MGERGQGTVEWVALLAVVALLLAALVAAGVRVPGADLARAIASRLLCAAAIAERCGDEPRLIAAYGTEVGKLVRRHMPTLLFEQGSRALPVDFRRCRATDCSDGSVRGLVGETDTGLPVTAFVRVVDCREDAVDLSEAAVADCSGPRAGNLYIQYWTYYPDSATLRGVPVAGAAGFHRDDWESTQVRIGRDGRVDQRASSHHGYNHVRSLANAGSDAGLIPLRDAAALRPPRPRRAGGSGRRPSRRWRGCARGCSRGGRRLAGRRGRPGRCGLEWTPSRRGGSRRLRRPAPRAGWPSRGSRSSTGCRDCLRAGRSSRPRRLRSGRRRPRGNRPPGRTPSPAAPCPSRRRARERTRRSNPSRGSAGSPPATPATPAQKGESAYAAAPASPLPSHRRRSAAVHPRTARQ